MLRTAVCGAVVSAGALSLSAFAQPTQVPLRAEIVSAAKISTSAIEVQEGRFGRLGLPNSGFCTYRFDIEAGVTVTDSTGDYGPNVVTPDGCFAPDAPEAPRFELLCPAGEQIDFRVNALPGAAKARLSVSGFVVEGGRIERRGDTVRLFCTARSGRVAIRVSTAFTLTLESAPGEGDLGALEFDTAF